MATEDLTRAIDEMRAAHAASVERSDELFGGRRADAAAIERLRRAPGPVGEALRRAEDALLRDLRSMPQPVAERGAVRPRATGTCVRLSPADFAYRTLGR